MDSKRLQMRADISGYLIWCPYAHRWIEANVLLFLLRQPACCMRYIYALVSAGCNRTFRTFPSCALCEKFIDEVALLYVQRHDPKRIPGASQDMVNNSVYDACRIH